MVHVLKRDHDPALDVFHDGIAELHHEGRLVGHVATTLSTMWSPGRPLTRQDWVWLLVIWADGERERPFEDYPPWTSVTEILGGSLTWDEGSHRGTYVVSWLPQSEREAAWSGLGISHRDF